MPRAAKFALLALLVMGCTQPERPPPAPRPAATPTQTVTAATPPPTAKATSEEPPAKEEGPSAEDAERVLFLATHLKTEPLRKACPESLPRKERIRCLITLRYEEDKASLGLALLLYDETGSLPGLLPEETTSDGHGGTVHLMPSRPVGAYREHLSWIISALRDYQRFVTGLSAHGTVSFKDRPLHFRFFYSEKGGHPSAFAINRNIGYNLLGALNVSDEAVRDTLFHEIFHLNDAWHGEWGSRALSPAFDQIVAKCGKKKDCLAPYSPTDTLKDGTYYAFSAGASAREYAAELGLRYYREHRLILESKPLPVAAFKCGPPENATVWRLLADEMFGGVDLVPACK